MTEPETYTPTRVLEALPDLQVVFLDRLSWTARGGTRSLSMLYTRGKPDLEVPWTCPLIDLRETPPERLERIQTVITSLVRPEGVHGGGERLAGLLERLGAKVIYPKREAA